MATRKETRSLADFVADVADRKSRAAQARFSETPPGQETPRDIYQAACALIGAHLEKSHGFKYAKSGPRARKRSRDFTFEISFQSDRNNIAGERVGLWIHGTVRSARFKKWGASHPFVQSRDFVAGGQIGNLQPNHCWLDWELADPGKRDETIGDAIKAIEELALAFFGKFEDLPTLFHLLVTEDTEDMPAWRLLGVIEFLMCFADQRTAQLAAANFLKRRPNLIPAYQNDLARYAEFGPAFKHPSGWTEELAFASQAFEFGNVAEGAPSSLSL